MNERHSDFLRALQASPKVDSNLVQQYQSWVRKYLRYCAKEILEVGRESGIKSFLSKMKDFGRDKQQVEQALHAIRIYCNTLELHQERETSFDKMPKVEKEWGAATKRMREVLRTCNYSPRTMKSYTDWVRKFEKYTGKRLLDEVGGKEIADWITYLAVERNVAASTQNQAFNAALYFFKHGVGRMVEVDPRSIRAKVAKRVPKSLTQSEISGICAKLDDPYRLMIELMYGCGLRQGEVLRLKVCDIDLSRMTVTVWLAKGQKSRNVPLPSRLLERLREQLNVARNAFKDAQKYAEYEGILHSDYRMRSFSKTKLKSWGQHWFFPASCLTRVDGKLWRHHTYSEYLQKALRRACMEFEVGKRVTCHSFRHSYASHLLEQGLDVRTLQRLLGHADVKTTMVYLSGVRSNQSAFSPLDTMESYVEEKL